MIKPTRGYTSSDGAMHATLEAAQAAELAVFINEGSDALKFEVWTGDDATALALWLISERAERLRDLLTTGPRSRPTRRKVNGAPSPKRAARPVKETRVSRGPALDEDGEPIGAVPGVVVHAPVRKEATP